MPVSKKQLQRLVRLVSQLKENRYPNCSTFALAMRKADLDENLNVSCTPKTIFRDIQTLKNDFNAPIKFDKVRNGYYLAHHGWNFSCPQLYDDSEMLAAVLREIITHLDNSKFLGTAIFSYWRYLTHWHQAPLPEDAIEWFTLAFERLEKLASEGK